jgi:hypothetical protein
VIGSTRVGRVVEVEVKNGSEYAFGVDEDGKIIVRWVALDQSIMPAEVLAAAKKAHPNGKIGSEYSLPFVC